MEKINDYTTLCLIDNFGCTRSVDNEITYHCFVENCIFETANLGEVLEHFDVHEAKWFGFCYACNVQIHDDRVPLLKELQHWNNDHRRDKNGTSVVFQPGDKPNRLREAVDAARSKRLPTDNNSQLDLICLKPWSNPTLKTRENCSKMLSNACLYSLYKCMDSNCGFSISCNQSMLIHLEYHENRAANAPIADTSWLECAYCDLISTPLSLVQHIREEHSSSVYQCTYCFYRSCTASNVVFHLKKFHESRINSVLVCRGKKLKEMNSLEKIVVEENRSKHVFPLRCSEVCNEITYLMDYFIHHLKTTAHDNHFKCQFCGSNILIAEAIHHLSLHHIGVYQCIYCPWGTNILESIHNHMCHAHPSRLPYICVRLTRKHGILREEGLSSVGSTLISNLSQTVHPKWLTKCPLTYEELPNDPLGPATAEPNPEEDFSEDSRLINNDPSFDGRAVLSYDDLERDYSSDDWNEYFATNQLQLLLPNDDISERKMDVDEGFESEACNSTTISQMDRSEVDNLSEADKEENISNTNLMLFVSQSPVMHSVERKETKRDHCLSISDDCQSKRSMRLIEKRNNVGVQSTAEQFVRPYEPNLSNVFSYRCAYCSKPFTNPQLVYEHWKEEHAKSNAAFMFQVTKIFKCCYCRYSNIYGDLKRHCEQKHPKETFAVIDKINKRKCALCTTEFCNVSTKLIVDHFEQHHDAAETNNTIRLESYLTDEWLDRIIAEQIHGRSGPVSGQIMYVCPNCPTARYNNQLEMIAHIRKHFLRFQCSYCDKTFDQIEMLQQHHAIAHKNDRPLSVISANENVGNYLEMKIIFPNGLMLTKRECVNTRFGAVDELVEMIKELNGSDRETGPKDQQQTQSEQIPKSSPKSMMTRSKGRTKKEPSPSASSLLPQTKCGCVDDVDRKKPHGRQKSVPKRNGSSTIASGVTTRRSNRNIKLK